MTGGGNILDEFNINNSKANVMQLQKKLRSLSRFTDDPALSVAVDGAYDESTRNAVKYFQSLYGIEETGVVDFVTWKAVDDEYRYYSEVFGKSLSISPFPDNDAFSLSVGDRSDLVLIVQLMLNELRLFYDLYGFIPPNGRYSSVTESAVREFQRAGGLEETGRVDRLTWNRLAEEYDIALREGIGEA